MSEATAVAELPITTPETPAVPQQEAPTTELTTTQEAETTGGLLTEGTATESGTGGTEGDGAEADFKLEDLDAFKELGVEPEPEPQPSVGKPLAEVEAETRLNQARAYAQLLSNGKTWATTRLTQQLGLDSETAEAVWQQIVSPLATSLHGNNEAFNAEVFNHSVRTALDPEDAEAWFGKQYKDRSEGLKALVELGAAKEKARQAADHKAGKRYSLTPEQLKKIVNEGATKLIAAGQRQGASGHGGQVAQGGASGATGQFRNVIELDRWYNDHPDQHATYAREHKRLTGRAP